MHNYSYSAQLALLNVRVMSRMSSTTGLGFTTCILLACIVYGGKSARVKIFLHQEAIEPMHARQATPSVCTEYTQVTNKSTLSFPTGFQHLPKPWESGKLNIKVIRSAAVTSGINKLLESQLVPGLNGVTARQVKSTYNSTILPLFSIWWFCA